MIFSSIEYVIFFSTLLVLLAILRSAQVKRTLLLVGSYFFYAYWDWRFAFMMLAMSLASYYMGRKIESASAQIERKSWLILSVVSNLGILGCFKYFNFFIDSANHLFGLLGARIPLLNIILPVGISFITFEVISYTIDIYRGTNKSARSFWELALLVAFFPHLIAGPILKPRQFLPQLSKEIRIERRNLEVGLQIFLFGLVKKILFADQLAPFVDSVFRSPNLYSSTTVWLAVLAYAIQIYCDFSGYSDMAIGSARCMGFDIPQNFNLPYVSLNITEFWRRWHISLSTWLREYLYISLGGNRKGTFRQYVNLMIVMLLGGLWHGASWNFVVWGGMHGTALVIHKLYMDYVPQGPLTRAPIYQAFSWLLTMVFVCTAWVFFRASNFEVSSVIVRKMYGLTDTAGINWLATSMAVIVPLLILGHLIGKRRDGYLTLRLGTFTGQFVFWFGLLGLLLLAPVASSPFIYFQF